MGVHRLRPSAPRGRSVKLNAKLGLSFLALGVIPAVLLSVFAYRSSAGHLREAAADRLEDAAITDGDMIDRNLFERYGDVQAFAANPMARGLDTERQEIVDFLTANYGVYDLMIITDLNGRSSPPTPSMGRASARHQRPGGA